MGDFVDILRGFNLTPINSVLLALLAYFVSRFVREVIKRLDAIDGPKGRLYCIEKRDTRQNLAIALIEQRIGMESQPEDDEP